MKDKCKIGLQKVITRIFLFLIPAVGFAEGDLKGITPGGIVDEVYSLDEWQQIVWINNHSFSYVFHDTLFKYNTQNSKTAVVLTLDEINDLIPQDRFTDIFPSYFWKDKSLYILNSQWLYELMPDDKKYYKGFLWPYGSDSIEISNDYGHVAFLNRNDIYISDLKGNIVSITDDGSDDIINGHLVHRSEFGIEKGMFWSNNGKMLAYYKNDVSGINSYPLVDINHPMAIARNIKYPMAGMPGEKVKLFIYNLNSGKHVQLIPYETDVYITSITWGPEDKFLYAGILNRDQNHLKFYKFDVTNGQPVKMMFEEKSDMYVEPQFPAFFSEGINDKFIWISRKDGYNHLYLYDTSGVLIKQLTSGNWEVTDMIKPNLKNEEVFFKATKTNPLQRHIYKVDVSTGSIFRITKFGGNHSASFSPDNFLFIDQYSDMNIPNKVQLLTSNGKMMRLLFKQTNPFKNILLGERTVSTIKAADNQTDLYYRMIKPVDFDSLKKYPVLYYVYGGPHVQLVTDEWPDRSELFMQYMAKQGFVSFCLDNRGSGYRGMDFESIIFRQFGQVEMLDQLKGIDFLKSLDWIDTTRIGIYGWSFGGFMTLSLVLNHPEIFKVGISGGPVTDWKMYEAMYTERYMDTPDKNPEGYEISDLNSKVDRLNSKLLLIHGAMDDVVVWQHSLKFIESCIKTGKDVDYFIYPTHEHNVLGKDRAHLYHKFSLYFNTFL